MSNPDQQISFNLQVDLPNCYNNIDFWGTVGETFTLYNPQGSCGRCRLPAGSIITVSNIDDSMFSAYLLCSGTLSSDEGTQDVDLMFISTAVASNQKSRTDNEDAQLLCKEAELYNGKLYHAQRKFVPYFYGLYSAKTETGEVFCFVIDRWGKCADDVLQIPVDSKIRILQTLQTLHQEFKVCHTRFDQFKVQFKGDEIRFVDFRVSKCYFDEEECEDDGDSDEEDREHDCTCHQDIFKFDKDSGSYPMLGAETCQCYGICKAASALSATRVRVVIKGRHCVGDFPDANICEQLLKLWGLKEFPEDWNDWRVVENALRTARGAIRKAKDIGEDVDIDDLTLDKLGFQSLQKFLEEMKTGSSGSSGEVESANEE